MHARMHRARRVGAHAVSLGFRRGGRGTHVPPSPNLPSLNGAVFGAREMWGWAAPDCGCQGRFTLTTPVMDAGFGLHILYLWVPSVIHRLSFFLPSY